MTTEPTRLCGGCDAGYCDECTGDYCTCPCRDDWAVPEETPDAP